MKGLFKLMSGLALGAAMGAGLYLLLTRDGEQGFLGDLKKLANEAVAEGKRAAAQRRQELEIELGQQPTAAPIG